MNIGWISLHRKICDNWVWKDKPFSYGQAWIDILLECNHDENKVLIKKKLLIVQRGESVNSLKTWANRWGWSISATRHFLGLLKNDKMCDMVNERVTTRLIVCNYDSYQDTQHAKGTQKKRRRNAEETQEDTNNKENNDNNENNIIKDSMEMWNFFASKYGVSKILVMSDGRKSKLRVRLKEKGFNLLEILKKSEKQSFLYGDNDKNWKFTFDWVIENEGNYIKILEEQYLRGDDGTSKRSVTESELREFSQSIADDPRYK